MAIKVYPYKQGSASAKALAIALEGKVLKHVGSKFRPKAGDVVINWGSSNIPDFSPATTLNASVEDAQCKLACLRLLSAHGVRVPDFWTRKPEHPDEEKSFPIVCRTKLKGHSGEGIVIANNPDELVDAPLYTKYIKKKYEYRVHVIKTWEDGEEKYIDFFVQRKARKLDVENPNWKIRNLEGGFVFVEADEAEVPGDVYEQSIMAIRALGLDFGGVDVIWNEKEGKAYVLEVNTACGLEERTAGRYAAAIRSAV